VSSNQAVPEPFLTTSLTCAVTAFIGVVRSAARKLQLLSPTRLPPTKTVEIRLLAESLNWTVILAWLEVPGFLPTWNSKLNSPETYYALGDDLVATCAGSLNDFTPPWNTVVSIVVAPLIPPQPVVPSSKPGFISTLTIGSGVVEGVVSWRCCWRRRWRWRRRAEGDICDYSIG
jgi:hypothetical protein